ncbi:Spy/CpxP family protein refolding chaperone [Kaustia mangrovi]|uniref:Spy/CpxP family protein refolding chaperone n=1 Tax=Kaustia mangrovi TaxID=2593653 RepID=A0A7S8C3U7_9HYPH|nr:Spy/CpxP family protein refolding chaperone [Kaustia mangrovi]QPC42851.1 Spy/CpxP family protein refolding chaperone [Kaustia mangrovi]
MSNRKIPTTLLAAAVIALGVGGSALADDDDTDGYGWWPGYGMHHMMGHRGMGGPMMGYGSGMMLDRIDGRLAFMKAELAITDAQEAQWDTFAKTLRETAQSRNEMMTQMMMQMRDGEIFKMSLPDRLDFRLGHMEARLAQMKDLKGAVDQLYAVLDDKQKEQADQVVLPMMGMGMGMGPGRGMGRGRGMGMQRGGGMMMPQ